MRLSRNFCSSSMDTSASLNRETFDAPETKRIKTSVEEEDKATEGNALQVLVQPQIPVLELLPQDVLNEIMHRTPPEDVHQLRRVSFFL